MGGENLSMKYSDKAKESAIKDVSIKALKGSIIAVIGENGAGKTTLFSLLAGARSPNSGKLYHSKPKGSIRVASVSALSLPPSFCSTSLYSKIMRLCHSIPLEEVKLFENISQHFFRRKVPQSSILKSLEYALKLCPDVLLLDEAISPETKDELSFFLRSREVRKQIQLATLVATHDL